MTNKQKLSKVLNSVPAGIDIPPQPAVLKELQQEINKEDTNVARVAQLISHDVAISAAILKTVNSSYFGLQHKVQSIAHAISMLGVEATKNLAASFLLKKEFEERGIEFPRFWDSASTTADLSAYIAKRLELKSPDVAFTLGLFHDVGIPLMAKKYPDYMDVLKEANESHSEFFTDIENSAYSTDHAIVATTVMFEWGISETIRNVILYHHEFEDFCYFDKSENKEQSKLLSVLKIAELGNSLMRGGVPDPDWDRFGDSITQFLGLSEDDIYELINDFKVLAS